MKRNLGRRVKWKLVDIICKMLIWFGGMSVKQCCVGFAYEVEISSELQDQS